MVCAYEYSQANSDTNQDIIWAFGTTNPKSNKKDANLIQHVDQGTFQLNLQGSKGFLNPINPSQGSGSGSGSGSGTDGSNSNPTVPSGGGIPFQPYEKKIIAHAFFAGFGYLILLPIGSLVARWLRLLLPTKWLTAHAAIQGWIGTSSLPPISL